MRKFILLTVFLLGGCAHETAVVTRVPCILPPDLKERSVMPDNPVEKTPLPKAGQAWAKDRAAGAKAVKKHNDTLDFVQRNCQ